MTKDTITVRRGNIKITINRTTREKNGRLYTSFIVNEYVNGKRKQWSFADLHKAKAKANEIADSVKAGLSEAERFDIGIRMEIRKAFEALEPTGISLLRAAELISQAIAVVGAPEKVIPACLYFAAHGPLQDVDARTVQQAVAEYQAARTWISFRRRKTETTYFSALTSRFGEKLFHDLTDAELEDFLNGKSWSAKTRNDFLTAVAGLYRFGQRRRWTSKEHNPATLVKRLKVSYGNIKIFDVAELRQLFQRLTIRNPELVPFLALWSFAGIRKDEIARMNWSQITSALTTGYIELEGRHTKTKQSRIIRVTPNLRAWLLAFRLESGPVVPNHWLAPTKTAENRLDEIGRFIGRRTGMQWKSNAPRHSYATYAFTLWKDAGEVVRSMGTSLQKFEKHYWAKSKIVTESAAKEYFEIMPEVAGKIIGMPLEQVSSNADRVESISIG